jgi:IS30 family transposase
MLQKEQWMQIRVLKAKGLSVREIARRLSVSRNTVTRNGNTQASFCHTDQSSSEMIRSATVLRSGSTMSG